MESIVRHQRLDVLLAVFVATILVFMLCFLKFLIESKHWLINYTSNTNYAGPYFHATEAHPLRKKTHFIQQFNQGFLLARARISATKPTRTPSERYKRNRSS